MMYLVKNYPLAKSSVDKYIILNHEDLYKLVKEHEKILDPVIGRIRMLELGLYTFIASDGSNYYLDTDPTLYSYINSVSTNQLVSNGLYVVSEDIEKSLWIAICDIKQYIGHPKIKKYLNNSISDYEIDTELYNIFMGILRYRAGEQDMENQEIINAYNAMQQQLVALENSTTSEILTKLLEVSDQINNISTYLASLRPESNMYILTSGLIESFNHLVNVCNATTQ